MLPLHYGILSRFFACLKENVNGGLIAGEHIVGAAAHNDRRAPIRNGADHAGLHHKQLIVEGHTVNAAVAAVTEHIAQCCCGSLLRRFKCLFIKACLFGCDGN